MSEPADNIAMNQNQILQASHHILTLMERSKEQLERFVDRLPSVFCVSSVQGQVVKGNAELADRFGCQLEGLLAKNLSSLFKPATWTLLADQMRGVAAGDTRQTSLELPLDAGDKDLKTFSWTLRAFEGNTSASGPLVTVFGVDVSEIRAYERQLSQIFSSIPLGILRVDQSLKVVPPLSAYVSRILRNDHVVGKNLNDVLFAPAWEQLSNLQREYTGNLTSIMGFPEFQYELMKDHLPRLISIPDPSPTDPKMVRWIGINYDPIVQDGVIDGLLLILEDRTEVERMRAEQEARQLSEEAVIRRFVEVRRLEPEVRRMVQTDIRAFIDSIGESLAADDLAQTLRTLHGIKGVSRVAQLTRLKELSHAAETALLGLSAAEQASWRQHEGLITGIVDEWNEVEAILAALNAPIGTRGLATKPAPGSLVALAHIEPRLKLTVKETAKAVSKDVELSCKWGDVHLPQEVVGKLSECLLHILNNAVDHGLEANTERLTSGKRAEGRLVIHAVRTDKLIEIMVADDGHGINAVAVARSALAKGVITPQEAATLSVQDKVELIFRAGFSTRDAASDISGRGIGLDAVAAVVKSLGGTISLATELGEGTTFTIRFEHGNS